MTDEMNRKDAWIEQHLAAGVELPFSFTYGGRPSAELLAAWPVQAERQELDAARVRRTLTWTDPASGLEVRCAAVEYRDFPTVEWTLWLRNTGAADTPLVENLQALDVSLPSPEHGAYLLHHAVGSQPSAQDYGPRETRLDPGTSLRLGTYGGRPTRGAMPYFDLEGEGDGVILVLGWPGQWSAEFTCAPDRAVSVRGGQEQTRFKLLPGEEVRSPLAVVQFYQGSWLQGQNLWRQWMIAHNLPRPGGKLPEPMLLASGSCVYSEMTQANEENQIAYLDRAHDEHLGLDYLWMDAGWYPNETGWWHVGTWEVDTARFPRGLRSISDHAHALGIKTLLWFEPERVTLNTWLADNHPEWLLGDGDVRLLNLGDPAARQWLTDHVDRLLTENGIDLYRQDFNMEPLELWRAHDAADRQGITEIQHVMGYLAYWDELRRRHPDMLTDTCAGGGRRNDLESLRRAVPLTRSDYLLEPLGDQGMTYGMSFWIPFYGTATVGTVAAWAKPYTLHEGVTPVEPYVFWSNATPSLLLGMDLSQKAIDYDTLRRLLAQWREVNPCYFGDFYPLTPYSLDPDAWLAWQFDLAAEGRGMVQAFRRAECPRESLTVRLHGLDAEARYAVVNLATGEARELTGRQLLEEGLPLAAAEAPTALVVSYRKVG